METAHVIAVIEMQFRRGKGTPDSPVRIVTQYRTLDGELLAERDPETDVQRAAHD